MKGASLLVATAVAVSVLGCGAAGGSPPPDVADTVAFDADDAAGDPGMVDVPAADDAGGDPGTVDVPDAPDAPDASDLPADVDVPDDPGPPPPLWEGLAGGGATLRQMFGVSSHMRQGPGDDSRRDFEFQMYAAAGGARVREDYHWHRIEPSDDAFTFEPVATQVEMARQTGIRLLPMLAYEVDWAMTGGTTDSIDPGEYGEFAGRVAREFCTDIQHFEIWNEQNITRFWTQAPNPARYGQFLKAAATAIRAECPGARIVFGGMASYDDVDMFNRWGFLRRAFEAHPDLCDYFDVLAVHPYTWFQFDPPERDSAGVAFAMESQTAMTAIARDILGAGGCGDRPVWFTEVGWPSYELTEAQVGRFAARSFLLAARDGVEAYFWYTFWDGRPTTEGLRPHESYFGLFGWPGEDGTVRRAKPAWTALKTMLDRMGDARFARDLGPALGLPNDVFALAFVGDGGRVLVGLWDGRESPDETPDGVAPGGPDTTFDLVLPLPEDMAVIAAWDLAGQDLPLPDPGAGVPVTLTISPVFLALEPVS